MRYLLVALLFFSCKTSYYFDANGCEHGTYRKIKEQEIVKYGNNYYYVLRAKNVIASGNLFDTTNWQQMKVDLLKPITKSKCDCNEKRR